MKEFYGDVFITEKRRVRVMFHAAKKPTKAAMLEILNNQQFDDVTDEETIEVLSVEKLDVKELIDREDSEE